MNIGTLTIELSANVAKLRTDMDQAKQVVTSGVEQISTAIATAKNALAGLGAVTSVAGFAALVDKTIESAAEMHRLSQRTGVAVESLSALKSAAKFTGTSMDEIGGAMQKLSKGMVDATEDGGKTGQALKLLGISVKDASGKMKSADQVTLEVAKSLEQYKDGAGKTAVVMDIFGKSGANLLPMLTELAEKGNLNGKITTEQAKQAYEFEKALAKLKNQFTGMFNALALDLIPVISKMSGLFKTGMEVAVAYWAVFYGVPALVTMGTAALGRLQMTLALVQLEMAQGATVASLFGRSIASITGPAELAQGALGKLKVAGGVLIAAYAGWELGKWLSENFSWARQAGIYMVGGLTQAFEALKAAGEVLWVTLKSGFNAVLEPVGNMTAWLFEKVATGLKMIGAGEVSKALNEISDKIRSFSKNNSSFADELGKVTAEYQKNRAAITQNIDGMLEYERSEKKVAEATQNTKKDLKATAEAAAAKESDYQKLIRTMREKVAAAEAELVAGRALNEAERERMKLLSDIANGTIKVTEYEKKRLLTQIGLLDSLLKSKQASEAMKKVFDDWNQASKQRIDAAEKEAEAAEKMVATLGMTRSEIAQLELSRLQEQLAQRSSIGLTLDEIKELEKLIEAKRRSANAFKAAEAYDAALKAAQALADEWKRMADDINQSLSKAIMKGFTGTKGFITDFIAQLKGLFAKLVLQPILAPVSAGIASIMVPGGAQAQPGGAAGGIGGAVNAISTGQSIINLVSNGFTGMSTMLGNGIASLGSMIGSSSMSAFGAGMIAPNAAIHGTTMTAAELYGSMGMTTQASAASLGSSVASAMPYVAAAVAAYYVATKGFGHGDRKTESEDITANLSGGDVTGSKNVHHVKEGGWFSSDIRGVWNFDLNSGKTVADGVSYNDTTGTAIAAGKAIKAGYDALIASSEGYAKALGVNAEFLKTTSYSLSFDVGKTQEEFAQNLSKALGTVADAMANQIYPGISKLAKEGETAGQTLARVAGDVSSVNDVFGKLGLSLFAISDAGLTAVEKLVAASGGLQNFQQASSNYYANFYSEEEKRATVIRQLTDEFAKANLGTLPQTREGFRALVEQMSKAGTPEQVAALLRLSGAFASVVPAIDQVTKATEELNLAAQQQELTIKILQLQGNATAALAMQREKELAALDPSLRGLQQWINALEDQKTATESAAAAAKAAADRERELANQRNDLQIQVLQLEGNATAALAMQRQKELAALDPSLQALQRRIYALQDEKTAADSAKAATASAFDGLKTAITNQKSVIDAAYAKQSAALKAHADQVRAQYQAQTQAAQASLNAINSVVAKLSGVANNLRVDDVVTGFSRRLSAINQAQSAVSSVKAGASILSVSGMDDMLRELQKPSEQFYSSFEAYAYDQARAAGSIAELERMGKAQASVAEMTLASINAAAAAAQAEFEQQQAVLDAQHKEDLAKLDEQLAAAQAQLDAINGVSKNVMSVEAALKAFSQALAAQNAAKAAGVAGGSSGGRDPATSARNADDEQRKLTREFSIKRTEAMAAALDKNIRDKDFLSSVGISESVAKDMLAFSQDMIKRGGSTVQYDVYSLLSESLGFDVKEAASAYLKTKGGADKKGDILFDRDAPTNPFAAAGYVDADKAAQLAERLGYSRSIIDGSHKDGLDFVPKDDYIARLHYGEEVLTQGEAKERRNGKDAEVTALRDEVKQLRSDANSFLTALVQNSGKITRILTRVAQDGDAIVTKAASTS